MSLTKEVVIIGAGWSGLSAACYLTKNNINVTVYESSKRSGGRARTIEINNKEYDNGQHLLIGAYHETLNLMALINADIKSNLRQKPLRLQMLNLLNEEIVIRTLNLPSPFNLFFGLLISSKLRLNYKFNLISFFLKIIKKKSFAPDISVLKLLNLYQQPQFLINTLWQPLCLATLNTPIINASANIFITVLQKSLLGNKTDSDFLYTTNCLGELLPAPAEKYINNKIQLSSRVSELLISNNSITGIRIDGNIIHTKNVILAIPPYACIALISKYKILTTLEQQLSNFSYQPICTIYLQFPENISLGTEMIGLYGAHIQWLFDRKVTSQPGLIAVVLSAEGPHMDFDNTQLINVIKSEIKQLFPKWPAPLFSKIIREKRATFNCDFQSSGNRPNNNTAIKGLWLCGDYTNTGLPACLEGAIISGKNTANTITSTLTKQS